MPLNEYQTLLTVFDGLACDTTICQRLGNSFQCGLTNLLDCSANGRVTALRIINTTISGTIASEISGLNALTELILRSNFLRGPLVTGLFALTSLVTLNLRNNRLTGTLPSALSLLTKLTDLKLDANRFVGEQPVLNASQFTMGCQMDNNCLDCNVLRVCTCLPERQFMPFCNGSTTLPPATPMPVPQSMPRSTLAPTATPRTTPVPSRTPNSVAGSTVVTVTLTTTTATLAPSTTLATTTKATTPATTTSAPTTTQSGVAAAAPSSGNAAVIGGAVGGAIAALLLIGVLVFCLVRRRSPSAEPERGSTARDQYGPAPVRPATLDTAMAATYGDGHVGGTTFAPEPSAPTASTYGTVGSAIASAATPMYTAAPRAPAALSESTYSDLTLN